jgi:hypothetical protein
MSNSWIGIWFTALFRPSVSRYENLISNPKASAKTAYIWAIITQVIGAIISFVLLVDHQKLFLYLLCGTPLLIIGAVLLLVIIAGSVHIIARPLGGMGTYSNTVYLVSAFSSPMTIVSLILYYLPLGKWLFVFLLIYWIILTVTAAKTVYKLSWGKSVVSSSVLIVLCVMASIVNFFLPNSI